MINHINQPGQPQVLKTGSYQIGPNIGIAIVNNKDEAMMMNVTKGYALYIFERYNPIFYIKEADAISGQISFSEYEYEEVQHKPAPDPSIFVTKNDMNNFKNDIMNSIATLLAQQKEGDICG